MLSRRALIGKAAVGAAAAAVVVGAAGTALASPRARHTATGDGPNNRDGRAGDPDRPSAVPPPAEAAAIAAPPPWELLSPFAAGAVVAHGWRLADLSPVRDGSCVATLENARGRTHRIHLCRNEGSPQGIIYTRRLDLVVMNGGRGDLPTDEGLAQAVAALAHAVAANEAKASDGVLAELMPHAERLVRFASDGTPATDGKLR